MLQTLAIIVLLCVIGIQAVCIGMLRGRLRRAEREIASWKLAVASYEKERGSW